MNSHFLNIPGQKMVAEHTKIIYTRTDGSVYEKMVGTNYWVAVIPSANPNPFMKTKDKITEIVLTQPNGKTYSTYNLHEWKNEPEIRNNSIDTSKLKKATIEDINNNYIITSDKPYLISIEPNPATDFSVFKYFIPESNHVTFTIVTLEGNVISTPIDGNQKKGENMFTLDTKNFANGTYIYRINVGSNVISGVFQVVK